ncbi:MAG: hypothetical protein RM338_32225 [Nostoc sp. DedQUE12a]|nr:hypothetical protein [Nostoc sp. DedQUE12a]
MEQIALAPDTTKIGNKFVVRWRNIPLAGCGIAIAWSVVLANESRS